MAKKISRSALIGDQGIALIHRRAGQLGFVWTAGSNLDAGIDGLLEIRDAATEVVTNSIIQVQSKATEGRWTAETPASFEFLCDERDLNYWMQGNAPVILVASRPKTDEAYYVSIKDYFSDPADRASRRVLFNKQRDRFDIGARQALIDVALPRDRGVYFAPPPKEEDLVSNLLPVVARPRSIYVGETGLRGRDIRETLKQHGVGASEWFVRAGRVIAVHDLGEPPWDGICDRGTVESFDAGEWALADDPVRQAEFAELLYSCLAVKVRDDLRYNPRQKLFITKASEDFSPRHFGGVNGRPGRTVFKTYFRKTDATKVAFCRHSAFKAHFARLGDGWFLSVTPTYHFSSDGWWPSRRGGEFLSNAMRRERNDAVRQQLEMWARYLTGAADYSPPEYPLLVLGAPLVVEVGAGIDDKAWLGQEEPRETTNEQAMNSADAA